MDGCRNSQIALKLERLADLLDLEDANPHRVRAYRRAARTVAAWTEEIGDLLRRGEDLRALPGVGDRLAAVIAQLARTGSLPELDRLERQRDRGLEELLAVPHVSPRRARVLRRSLGIQGVSDLREAARAGRLRRVPGFGRRTEQLLVEALAEEAGARRHLRADLHVLAGALRDAVRAAPGVTAVEPAGSYRRRRETVRDLRFVAAAARGSPAIGLFLGHEEVVEILSRGEAEATARLRSGVEAGLRLVPPERFGAALLWDTGSRAHVEALSARAESRGLTLGPEGLFRGGRPEPCAAEPEIYAALGLPYLEPELREGRGETDLAQMPPLVTLADLRGDLHAHTTETDGRDSLERMAEGAAARGLSYLAITDHTQNLRITNGQDARRLARQMEAIDRLNAKMRGLRLLKGAEVDILEDGRLDLDDGILGELDVTVCSIHSAFRLPPEAQTARLCRALENPSCRIIGHLTGRLLLRRRGYGVDLDAVLRTAKAAGKALEINGQPDRLDLDDAAARRAREAGVRVAITSDAHSVREFEHLRHGVDQARRGWIAPSDVLNTRAVDDLLRIL